MPIAGLTNKAKMERDVRGKPVRIGYLQKGRRVGFGKSIKLVDEDHLIFRPVEGGELGDRLTAVFAEVYGAQPRAIDDVRIAADVAGNFDIQDCAWLYARRHGEKGSVLMAVSDGVNIKRARNEKTGRIEYWYDGEKLHDQHTRLDKDEKPAFAYRDKLYPWQQEMSIDLILPGFNRALAEQGIAGHGVVTLITHATYDIPALIAEYYGIIDELVGLIANPLDPNDRDQARRYLPLRNFPLRLYRSQDKITTPDWQNKDAGNRLNSTRWLLHWQLNPQFSAAMQEALDKRTQLTLAAVAQRPLLQAAAPARQLAAGSDVNGWLFGDEAAPAQLPAKVSMGPSWTDVVSEVIGEAEEVVAPKRTVEPYDWPAQLAAAETLDAWCAAAYQLLKQSGAFTDANHVKRGFPVIAEQWPPRDRKLAFDAFQKYASAVADGAKAKDAAGVAATWYAAQVEFLGGDDDTDTDGTDDVVEGEFEEEGQ